MTAKTSRMTARTSPGGVLALLCAVQFMVILDTTIANVALPGIGRDLDLPDTTLQYVVTLYSVTFGGCLILAGRAGDLLGRRRLFTGGTALFVAASTACGLSATPALLLTARALQGLGAAVISATALGLLLAIHAEGAGRNRALGVWSALGATGAGAGLILGGVLTDTLGWQWVFLINVPIGLAALTRIGILPADQALDREPAGRTPGHGPATGAPARGPAALDLPGAVTATTGIGLLIYGLSRGQQDGFTAPAALSLLAVATALLVAFVLIQRRSARPLIPLRILAHGTVTGANLAFLALMAVVGSQGFFMMLFMQGVLRYSPIETGLAVFPSTLMALAGSNLATRLAARFRPQVIAAAGLVLVGIAEALLARIATTSSYAMDILPGYLIFGLGLGSAFVGAGIVATTGTAAEDQGAVSGLLNTAQQVGIAIGVAALVALATAHTGSLPAPGSTAALVSGYRLSLLAGAGLAAAGALAVLTLGRPRTSAAARTPT
ncbi:MFS transporter [Nonomuraea jiangxiensis]|uniref:Major Facilitator Superfamily protein n=1 Tax=Nonomuraea jiangxiensis TaxID=633440 RepID=A0A1G8QIR4_9ACTN|nr:MFS transporter [Nonomuraea jiangxiensis]SDJ04622.1 Major Facilitator Superfamily protein [Nonomuraea jiangxiensis]